VPMAKQTKFDRALIFFRKIIRTQSMGCKPSAIKGRITGPKVLANSIPKAGTNLMERALTFTPGLRMAPFRTLMDWDECSSRTARRLRRLGNGQFINAHLPAHQEILNLVDNLGVKALFLIRDPRDVVISNYKYVNEIDTTHFSHKFISGLPDDSARLTAVINGIDGAVASVAELWRRFDGWFTAPNTLVIKYEDLIGSQGGGGRQSQLATILAIGSHLNIELSSGDIEYIARNVYSTKASTFRKGKIGTWKDVFTDEHVALFKAQTGDLLIRLGYEATSNWGVR
jgi:sulfotransferase 6B1